jgi:hypothetical protein
MQKVQAEIPALIAFPAGMPILKVSTIVLRVLWEDKLRM